MTTNDIDIQDFSTKKLYKLAINSFYQYLEEENEIDQLEIKHERGDEKLVDSFIDEINKTKISNKNIIIINVEKTQAVYSIYF